jgi:hypothetical protein
MQGNHASTRRQRWVCRHVSCLLLSWTILTWSLLPADSAIAPVESKQHENGTKEETLRWGEYTVAFFHDPNDRLADVAQIRDSKGRVRIEVRHDKILGPLDAGGAVPRDFNGDGIPELRILGWSGGAYCCYTEYLFDRRARLKNTLIAGARVERLEIPGGDTALSRVSESQGRRVSQPDPDRLSWSLHRNHTCASILGREGHLISSLIGARTVSIASRSSPI